jgi:hypothetical protein
MRALPILALTLVSGCAAAPVPAPSLAPRAAEAIDPRVPVPDVVVSTDVSVGLPAQLNALVAQAESGDAEFRPLAERAADLARAAGSKESESWIAAQQALSAAVAARGPVTRAVGDIDALGAQRIQKLGGIGLADLKAIDAAASRVAEIDQREAAAIDRVQALLSR